MSSARNANNNSRLSNNTRMINKVTAVQKKMQKQEGNPNQKITQIVIHNGLRQSRNNAAAALTQENQQTPALVSKEQPSSKKPEEGAHGARDVKPRQEDIKRNQSPGGLPAVQDVDAHEDPKAAYGQENFLPLKKLGSGSFGDVYLVRDKNSGKLFAMKTLSKRKILGQNLVRYAKTERDVLSYMRHPFIVNLNYAFQT